MPFKVGSHEGTCCRDMSRGRISCAVHTEGLVAGTCRDFVFWLVYFPKCRGDMSHEQFTRGDLAFNRGVTLFCRRDMSPQFKLIWIQGTCRGDKISSLRQDFLWKSSVHTMGFVAGTKSPRRINHSSSFRASCVCPWLLHSWHKPLPTGPLLATLLITQVHKGTVQKAEFGAEGGIAGRARINISSQRNVFWNLW